MIRRKIKRDRSEYVSWKIFLASTGLTLVLLTFSTLYASHHDIPLIQPLLHQSNKLDVTKERSFDTNLLEHNTPNSVMDNAKFRADVSLAALDTNTHLIEQHGPPLTKTYTSQNSSTMHLPPYQSMFSVPKSLWKLEGAKIAAVTGKNLRVYVYETIPVQYTDEIISCIMRQAGVNASTSSSFSSLSTKMADVAIIQLFRTYPGRVYKVEDADLFVVPYPHAAHCYCADGWEKACGQVDDTTINTIFESLPYYNASTAARHLFILSGIQYFMNDRLIQQPLKLVGGNLSPEEVATKATGTIVIPYLNDKAVFQQIFTAPASWWTRPRHIAFSFVYGAANKRNAGYDPRKIRKHFVKNWAHRNRTELGGLPVYIHSFDPINATPGNSMWTAFDRYHDSLFCPILAGDSCQQSRFFDALFSGCIPVVLRFRKTNNPKEYKDTWAENLSSWYRSGGESTVAVYPFHKNLVDFGIDYEKCVLTVPAEVQRDVRKLVNAMEKAILYEPMRIQQFQVNLRDCAIRTAFGLGQNAHKYQDAFAQIIYMIQHHLKSVKSERNKQNI
jgi:Exostosin family